MQRLLPSALTAWTRLVSGSISLPSPGYFSPFPHGTVHYRSRRVACLGPWSARLPTGFRVSRGTRDPDNQSWSRWYRTITASGVPSQALPRSQTPQLSAMHGGRPVSQPRWRNACTLGHANGLGSVPVRSPLLRDGYYFLQLLRCFSSPRSLPPSGGSPSSRWRGCPIRTQEARCVVAAPLLFRR